jgi:hypothetical protein
VATVLHGTQFEWDSDKAAENLAKHGVTFEEACTVFDDPRALYLDDGSGEGRIVVIGLSTAARCLYVVHVERGDRDRVVSARLATRAERDQYGDET